MSQLHTYNATMRRAVDGDTLDLDIDLGFHIHANIRVRLLGIDTPEIYHPRNAEEKIHGYEARNYVARVLPVGAKVTVTTSKTGKYGRWLARITYNAPDEGTDIMRLHDLTKDMLAEGLAKREEY